MQSKLPYYAYACKGQISSLDSGLLSEGHFLGPRIGRTVYFLDFSDVFYKQMCFLIWSFFLKHGARPDRVLGEPPKLPCLQNFEKLRFWKSSSW